MKNSLSPGVAIGAIVVVVLLLGFFAYKTFFSASDASPNSEAAKKEYDQTRANSAINQHMSGGGAQGGPQGGSAIQSGSAIQGGRGAYGRSGN
jgi:hypothetical protein